MSLHEYGGGSVAENLPAMQETQVPSLGQEHPVKKEIATHSISCLGNPMDRESWRATVHEVARVRYHLVAKPTMSMARIHTYTYIYVYTRKHINIHRHIHLYVDYICRLYIFM